MHYGLHSQLYWMCLLTDRIDLRNGFPLPTNEIPTRNSGHTCGEHQHLQTPNWNRERNNALATNTQTSLINLWCGSSTGWSFGSNAANLSSWASTKRHLCLKSCGKNVKSCTKMGSYMLTNEASSTLPWLPLNSLPCDHARSRCFWAWLQASIALQTLDPRPMKVVLFLNLENLIHFGFKLK